MAALILKLCQSGPTHLYLPTSLVKFIHAPPARRLSTYRAQSAALCSRPDSCPEPIYTKRGNLNSRIHLSAYPEYAPLALFTPAYPSNNDQSLHADCCSSGQPQRLTARRMSSSKRCRGLPTQSPMSQKQIRCLQSRPCPIKSREEQIGQS